MGTLAALPSVSLKSALSLQAFGDVKLSLLLQRLSKGRTVILEIGADRLKVSSVGDVPGVHQGGRGGAGSFSLGTCVARVSLGGQEDGGGAGSRMPAPHSHLAAPKVF